MKMKNAVALKSPKLTNGKVEKPKANKKVTKAEEAVHKYEEMKDQYIVMQKDFEKSFPQANAKLQEIKQLEDDIRQQIDGCKVLVRDAGQTIGEFAYTAKFTSEGYDGAKLVELISKLPKETAGELFKELAERGFIVEVVVDKAAAKVIRASDADLRDKLAVAWDKGGKAMTAAISVPKF